MARQIADALNYQGKQFLDARTHVTNIADFADGTIIIENYYPDGFIAYCEEDKAYYQFMSSNDALTTTGRWRKLGGLIDHQIKLVDGKVPDLADLDFEPSETDIHIFQADSFKYNNEEVKVHTRFELSAEAEALGWELDEAGIRGNMVSGYSRNDVVTPLKDKAWKSTDVAFYGIGTTGVYIRGELFPYEDINVDQVVEWEKLGYFKSFPLAETELISDAESNSIMVHISSDKSFDSMGNFERNYTAIDYAWNNVTDLIYNESRKRLITIVNDDDGIAAVISTSTGNVYDLYSKVEEAEINTGWTYDEDGGWTKIFPADIELDIASENAVSNSAVTRAINAAGHTAKLIYESEDKVLTLELDDKDGNVLSKVAVGLGTASTDQPKISLELEENLYELDGTDKVVKVTIHAVKTNNDIEKVELFANSTPIATFEGPDVDPETHDYEALPIFNSTVTFTAKITDKKGLTAEADIVKAYFVKPCLYNPNGGPAVEKLLTLKGEGKFKFNFDVAPAAGGDPVISAAPIIKIPEALVTDYGPIVTILGGKTEKYLYTDYIESFEKTDPTVDDPYVTYTLKTPCGLQDYYFATVR